LRKRVIGLGIYILTWLVFFILARFFFIVSQFREASLYDFGTLAATFIHGFKMDISTTGYLMLIPILLVIPELYFSGKWYKIFLKIYTFLTIIFSVILIVSDANLYTYWGFRMDYTPLLYLKTPADAMASVTGGQFVSMALLMLSLSALSILAFNKIINQFFTGFTRVRLWLPAIGFFLIMLGALIIPIRGGIGLAPINAGSVYFDESLFPNHTAINVIWNIGNSAIYQESDKNPYEYGDLATSTEIVNNLTAKKGITEKILNTTRPNVLIFVLESFGSYLIGPLGGDPAVTPNLNKYINEGVLFTNFYATGSRTDKAIPAILSGYPSQPTTSIIKDPKKSQSLPNIVKLLNNAGYNSSFWYGGDINFANFNSYLISSGFNQIITKDDFDPSNYNSKWGVHDHILLNALQDSMKNVKEPFVKAILTLSSHEPFEVPMDPVIKGSDEISMFKNSVYYADQSLGKFIEEAKKSDWWENTLIVLVADHCRRNSVDIPVYSQEIFKIPMLWLGGAILKEGVKIDKFGSQVDIPVTIADQLNLKSDFPFSKDLLSDESNSFAFYSFNEGFAFITDSSSLIYDHKLKLPVFFEGVNETSSENFGKAYLHVLFNDYLKR
jgi:glucan phosphoethanolaminetransferase (alkaline phosphatase superfamily)